MVSAPSTTPPTAHCPAAPSLPALSDHESHLLSTFLILRYDMVALAEQEKLQPAQLLAFAHSPAVQAHLAALKTFADQAYALRSLESRIQAIDALESITKTTDNPIEKRRAASSILRGLNPPGGIRSFRADRREPSVSVSTPPTKSPHANASVQSARPPNAHTAPAPATPPLRVASASPSEPTNSKPPAPTSSNPTPPPAIPRQPHPPASPPALLNEPLRNHLPGREAHPGIAHLTAAAGQPGPAP